jgi:chromosome segregation ATPase
VTSKAIKEERSRYLSSITELRNSLSQAEADIRTKDESINILTTSLKNTRDELKTSNEKYKRLQAEYSKLESEMECFRLSCDEKDKQIKEKNKRIEDLEDSILDEYEYGFLRAIQQVEILHPGLDLSGLDVREGRIVDP